MAVLAGTAVAIVLGPSAHADDAPGSGFGSVSLAADAGGQRIIADKLANQSPGTVDSGVPYAEAGMTQSTGHALSSVAWPSSLAGNAGSLLALLGPNPCTPGDVGPIALPPPVKPTCSPVGIPGPVMDQYHYLNSPVRAEAQYPTKPQADSSVPGGTMTASAGESASRADALIGGAVVSDVESLGTVRATSSVALTGAQAAVADAVSTMSDISIDGGIITIGSVESHAHGQTDGVVASSTGSTTVHDMKVAGTPVYVDATGVHAGSATAPVDSATSTVNQALSGAGFTIRLTQPTSVTKHGTTTYTAQSVIIDWNQGMTFVFGGAHIVAGATRPYALDLPSFTPATGAVPVPAPPGGAVAPPAEPAGALPAPVAGDVPAGVGPQPQVAPASPPLATVAAPGKLPGGIDPWWVVGCLVVGGLAMALLQRLPDDVLADTGSPCPLEEAP